MCLQVRFVVRMHFNEQIFIFRVDGLMLYFVLGPRDIISQIEDIGFEAILFKRDRHSGQDYLNQREEIKKWRNSFLVTFSFCTSLT